MWNLLVQCRDCRSAPDTIAVSKIARKWPVQSEFLRWLSLYTVHVETPQDGDPIEALKFLIHVSNSRTDPQAVLRCTWQKMCILSVCHGHACAIFTDHSLQIISPAVTRPHRSQQVLPRSRRGHEGYCYYQGLSLEPHVCQCMCVRAHVWNYSTLFPLLSDEPQTSFLNHEPSSFD